MGRFFMIFTVWNLLFLAVLTGVAVLLTWQSEVPGSILRLTNPPVCGIYLYLANLLYRFPPWGNVSTGRLGADYNAPRSAAL